MTHRIKSLFLGCLLIGQFYCSLSAMAAVKPSISPLAKIFQAREQIRLRGSQVPLSSPLRKCIARAALTTQHLKKVDRAYNLAVMLTCICIGMYILQYLTQATSLYVRSKRLEKRLTQSKQQRNLIEQKIISHFPPGIGIEDSASIISEFLNYEQQLNGACNVNRARYRSEQKQLMKDSLQKIRGFSAIMSISSLFLLSIVGLLWIIAYYFLLFTIICSAGITAPLYGTAEATATCSLLVYHNYDKFVFITSLILMLKYTLVMGCAVLPGFMNRQIRMP